MREEKSLAHKETNYVSSLLNEAASILEELESIDHKFKKFKQISTSKEENLRDQIDKNNDQEIVKKVAKNLISIAIKGFQKSKLGIISDVITHGNRLGDGELSKEEFNPKVIELKKRLEEIESELFRFSPPLAPSFRNKKKIINENVNRDIRLKRL